MHHALDGCEAPVGDRVGAFFRQGVEFSGVGQELPRYGTVRSRALDQRRHLRRYGHRIASRDGLKGRGGLCQSCHGKIVQRVERNAGLDHGSNSATGVQMTSSIRRAPVASMASRSKPRAMPLASGMIASASRKSSSSG